MKNRHAALVAALLIGLPATGANAQSPARVVDPGLQVEGVDQGEYAVRWWQWANRLPPGVRPYQDPTGMQCALNQSGGVWFLAGTDGTADVIRHCRMPTKTRVFLPIINMIEHSIPGNPKTCAQVTASVRANNDGHGKIEVLVDGRRVRDIERHRLTSGCFDAFTNAPYLDRPKSWFPAATDGYWLMLEPLTAGLHVIRVSARYDNPGAEMGELEQNFEYQLQVDEPSRPAHEPERRDAGIYL